MVSVASPSPMVRAEEDLGPPWLRPLLGNRQSHLHPDHHHASATPALETMASKPASKKMGRGRNRRAIVVSAIGYDDRVCV